ncbi:MAG: hypothetical protein ABW091_15090 [Microbacterium sp.]
MPGSIDQPDNEPTSSVPPAPPHPGVTTSLPDAMNGRASSAKAAVGDEPVFDYYAATLLDPVPPVAPVGMGKATRGVELATLDDLDEDQVATWMRQITSVPGLGGNRR